MGFKIYSNLSSPSRLDQKSGYVSDGKAPYVEKFTYSKKFGNSSGTYEDGRMVMPVNDPVGWSWWTSYVRDQAVRLAIGEFKERVFNNATASLGISIAQWDQTLGMASKRLNTLTNFARRLPGASLILLTGDYMRRKRALTALGRSLNLPANNSDLRRLHKRSLAEWRKIIRTPGDLWLEFWFGWSATVSDLSNVANVLSDPQPLVRVIRAGKPSYYERKVRENGSSGDWLQTVTEIRVSAGVSGTVTVTNPNAYLANRLGLVNLAAIAWDAIPFSWILGWFGNFKEFLDQLTWDTGLTVPQSTRLVGTRMELKMTRTGQVRSAAGKLYRVNGTSHLMASDRSKGWSGSVRLQFSPPTGNLTRSLSVASVLFQKLSKFSTPIDYRRA